VGSKGQWLGWQTDRLEWYFKGDDCATAQSTHKERNETSPKKERIVRKTESQPKRREKTQRLFGYLTKTSSMLHT